MRTGLTKMSCSASEFQTKSQDFNKDVILKRHVNKEM